MERQLNLLLSIQELCYQITMFTQHDASCFFVSVAKSIDVSIYENGYDSNRKRTFSQIETLYEQTESEATKKEVLERLRNLKKYLENTLENNLSV